MLYHSSYVPSGVSSVKIFTAFKWIKYNSSASSSVISSSIEEDAPPNNPSDLCYHSVGDVFSIKETASWERTDFNVFSTDVRTGIYKPIVSHFYRGAIKRVSVAKVWHNSLKESPGSALISNFAIIATKYFYV